MTLEEIAATFNEGLEPWQQDINLEWLKRVHKTLKIGGTWLYPEAEQLWIKTEEGFDEITTRSAGRTH